MNQEAIEISLTIPVYKSGEILPELVKKVDEALKHLGKAYEIIFVNDASPDGTWESITKICANHPHVVGINHRKNFGQDCGIMTALKHARGRFAVIMDDDLQHDPSDIPALYQVICEKNVDVVYATYAQKKQALWKNMGSWFNGKVAELVIGKPKGVYMSPYKIIRREVYQSIMSYQGPYPYIDGLLFQSTNRFSSISVRHHSRHSGRSSFTLGRSLNVWLRLAVSFSVRPLRIVTLVGMAVAFFSFLGALIVVAHRLLIPEDFGPGTTGWASLAFSVYFLSGVQMIFLGFIGEYVGRTHINTNTPPQSVTAEKINFSP